TIPAGGGGRYPTHPRLGGHGPAAHRPYRARRISGADGHPDVHLTGRGRFPAFDRHRLFVPRPAHSPDLSRPMATVAAPVSELPELNVPHLAYQPLSPTQLAWRSFRRHRMAMVGLVVLVLLSLYAMLGGMLWSHGYCAPIKAVVSGEAWANFNDTSLNLQPPSGAHPFGTDVIGRDIFARTVYGGQISLLIGVTATLLEVVLGTLVGAGAAYYGGWVDSVLMRFTEAMLTIPSLFLLIVTAKFFGGRLPSLNLFGRELTGSVIVIVLIIGLTSWMYLARIVRANVLSLREMDYVSAARALGVSNVRIIAS